VIGYLKDIENMPSGYEYSRQFFRRYYTPDTPPSSSRLLRSARHPRPDREGVWRVEGQAGRDADPRSRKQRQSRRAQVDWDKPTLRASGSAGTRRAPTT